MIRCKRQRRVSKIIILFIARGEARRGVARQGEQNSSRHSYTTPESQCRQQLWLGRRQRFDVVAPWQPWLAPITPLAPSTPAAHHTRPDGLLRPPKQQQKTRKHSNALRVQRSSSSAAQELQTLHSARRTFAITFVFVNAIADHISVAVAEGSAPPFSLSLARPPCATYCAVRAGPPKRKSHRFLLITSTMYLHLNCKQRHFVIVSHSMSITKWYGQANACVDRAAKLISWQQ